MADYSAPFQLPKFATSEWKEKKAAHVKAHGYAIYFPKIGDIIHIKQTRPITDHEKTLWYSGRRNEIPARRRKNLESQKARARQGYQKMLSSPIPNWLSNYTSVLTSWDNLQDVLITLAMIGRIAIKFLPKLALGWLGWPIGLLWLLASIMSAMAAPSMCVLSPMKCKRRMAAEVRRRNKMLRARGIAPERGTRAWLKMQASKLKHGFKGYARSGGFLPSFSEAIQALQVTKDIWGIGLSIGPVFGIVYDLMSGGVRWAQGDKVVFKNAPWDIEVYNKPGDTKYNYARYRRPGGTQTKTEYLNWRTKAMRDTNIGIRSEQDLLLQQALRQSQTTYGWLHGTDYEHEAAMYCGTEVAGQYMHSFIDAWNPMENIEGIEHIQIEAYNEPNPLIEEVLQEQGLNPDGGIQWPSTGTRWATYEDIQRTLAPIAAENFEYFVDHCRNEDLSAVAENSAIEHGLQAMHLLEGPGSVRIRYHAGITVAEMILNQNFAFPMDIEEPQMVQFATWCQAHEDNNTLPKADDVHAYAKNALDIKFKKVLVWIPEEEYEGLPEI